MHFGALNVRIVSQHRGTLRARWRLHKQSRGSWIIIVNQGSNNGEQNGRQDVRYVYTPLTARVYFRGGFHDDASSLSTKSFFITEEDLCYRIREEEMSLFFFMCFNMDGLRRSICQDYLE